MKILPLLFGLSILVDIPSAYATTPCYLDGEWYEHGTRVGSYVCNCGTWEKA